MKAFAVLVIVSTMVFSIIYKNDTFDRKKIVRKKDVTLWKEIMPIQVARKEDGTLVDTIDDDIILPVKKVKVHAQHARDLYQLHNNFIRRTKTKYIDNINNVVIPEASDDLTEEEKNIVRKFRSVNFEDDEEFDLDKQKEFIKKIQKEYIEEGRKFANGRSIYSYALSKYWNNHFTESPTIIHFNHNYDLNEYLYDGTTLIMNRVVSSSANVRDILFEGANVNMVSREGGASPIHFAALYSTKYSRGKKFNSAIYNNFSFLISYGADVNAQTKGEWILYEGHNNGEILKNKIGVKGITPLMIIEGDNGASSKLIAELLIKNGADVNLEDSKGNTAMNYISLPSDVGGSLWLVQEKVEFLVKNGADPMHKDSDGNTIFDRMKRKLDLNNNSSKKGQLLQKQKDISMIYSNWVEKIKNIRKEFKEGKITSREEVL